MLGLRIMFMMVVVVKMMGIDSENDQNRKEKGRRSNSRLDNCNMVMMITMTIIIYDDNKVVSH